MKISFVPKQFLSQALFFSGRLAELDLNTVGFCADMRGYVGNVCDLRKTCMLHYYIESREDDAVSILTGNNRFFWSFNWIENKAGQTLYEQFHIKKKTELFIGLIKEIRETKIDFRISIGVRSISKNFGDDTQIGEIEEFLTSQGR
jgi:hypothetical protein